MSIHELNSFVGSLFAQTERLIRAKKCKSARRFPGELCIFAIKYGCSRRDRKNELRKTKYCVSVPHRIGIVSSEQVSGQDKSGQAGDTNFICQNCLVYRCMTVRAM